MKKKAILAFALIITILLSNTSNLFFDYLDSPVNASGFGPGQGPGGGINPGDLQEGDLPIGGSSDNSSSVVSGSSEFFNYQVELLNPRDYHVLEPFFLKYTLQAKDIAVNASDKITPKKVIPPADVVFVFDSSDASLSSEFLPNIVNYVDLIKSSINDYNEINPDMPFNEFYIGIMAYNKYAYPYNDPDYASTSNSFYFNALDMDTTNLLQKLTTWHNSIKDISTESNLGDALRVAYIKSAFRNKHKKYIVHLSLKDADAYSINSNSPLYQYYEYSEAYNYQNAPSEYYVDMNGSNPSSNNSALDYFDKWYKWLRQYRHVDFYNFEISSVPLADYWSEFNSFLTSIYPANEISQKLCIINNSNENSRNNMIHQKFIKHFEKVFDETKNVAYTTQNNSFIAYKNKKIENMNFTSGPESDLFFKDASGNFPNVHSKDLGDIPYRFSEEDFIYYGDTKSFIVEMKASTPGLKSFNGSTLSYKFINGEDETVYSDPLPEININIVPQYLISDFIDTLTIETDKIVVAPNDTFIASYILSGDDIMLNADDDVITLNYINLIIDLPYNGELISMPQNFYLYESNKVIGTINNVKLIKKSNGLYSLGVHPFNLTFGVKNSEINTVDFSNAKLMASYTYNGESKNLELTCNKSIPVSIRDIELDVIGNDGVINTSDLNNVTISGVTEPGSGVVIKIIRDRRLLYSGGLTVNSSDGRFSINFDLSNYSPGEFVVEGVSTIGNQRSVDTKVFRTEGSYEIPFDIL